MFKKSITLLFAIASTVAIHAQEYFVRATSPDQLVGDVEFLLVHENGSTVSVATPETGKTGKQKGFQSKIFDVNEDKTITINPTDNVLRLNLKYTEAGKKIGYQLFISNSSKVSILRDYYKKSDEGNLEVTDQITSPTTIFEYQQSNGENYLFRAGLSAPNRIILEGAVFVGTKNKKTANNDKRLTCLYIKKNPPLSFSSKVNEKSAILYAPNLKIALGNTFSSSVELEPEHGTIFVGTRKDVMIFKQETTAEGITLQNEKGEYLSANSDGTLSLVKAKSNETTWEKIGGTKDVELRHKLSTKVLVYTPEKRIELKDQAASTNKVYLYCAAPTGSFKMSSAAYGTYYNEDFSYIMPEGLKGSTAIFTESGTEKKVVFNYEYPAGSIVPKKTPLVLKSTLEGNKILGLYSLKSTEEASEVSMHSGNVLRGLQVAGMIPQEGDNKYYKLSKHDDKVGFFFGVAGGAAFKIETNNRAYLVLPSSAASKGFYMDEPILTGIEEVKPNVETKSMYYDLLGRPRATKSKGLNIYNGKKILF